MEDPNLDDFSDLLRELEQDDGTVDLFGASPENNGELPELFVPRALDKFKEEQLQLNKDAGLVADYTEFDVLIDDLQGVHAQRMNELLGNMTNSEFVVHYNRLLNYVRPKLKAIDIETHDPQELTQINVTVINSKEELQDG